MIPIVQGTDWLATRAMAEPFDEALSALVAGILRQVREEGDEALRALARQFGDPVRGDFALSDEERRARPAQGTCELLERAAANIERFARAIVESLQPVTVNASEYAAGLNYRPVDSVACYVPGGRHPLPSTALMTALAARAAGVPRVCLLCPSPHPAVVYAGRLARVDAIYRVGGAQAVAAVAYGTQTIERADMVVGPGNAYVTEAKRQLQGLIGIDMLAGPSEVTILADEHADPQRIALDLLAQAEHDPDARVYLVTWVPELAERVQRALEGNLEGLADFLPESLPKSALLVFETPEQCADCVNRIAPEHLHLQLREPGTLRPLLRHYGGLFVGSDCTVPFGDYMAGPNHTLPTGGTARFSAGLSPLTFLRPQCWLEVERPPQALARDTAAFAELEGLTAHARAARLRCPRG